MNELIKVNYDTEHPTVSARELHKALEVSSRFSRWFDTNKEMFVDGEDYNKCTSSTVVNNGAVREDFHFAAFCGEDEQLLGTGRKHGERDPEWKCDA